MDSSHIGTTKIGRGFELIPKKYLYKLESIMGNFQKKEKVKQYNWESETYNVIQHFFYNLAPTRETPLSQNFKKGKKNLNVFAVSISSSSKKLLVLRHINGILKILKFIIFGWIHVTKFNHPERIKTGMFWVSLICYKIQLFIAHFRCISLS